MWIPFHRAFAEYLLSQPMHKDEWETEKDQEIDQGLPHVRFYGWSIPAALVIQLLQCRVQFSLPLHQNIDQEPETIVYRSIKISKMECWTFDFKHVMPINMSNQQKDIFASWGFYKLVNHTHWNLGLTGSVKNYYQKIANNFRKVHPIASVLWQQSDSSYQNYSYPIRNWIHCHFLFHSK